MDYFLFNFSGVQFHYTMSLFYFLKSTMLSFLLMGIVGLTLRFVWILVLYFQMHMHISAVKSLALRVKPSIINTKSQEIHTVFFLICL